MGHTSQATIRSGSYDTTHATYSIGSSTVASPGSNQPITHATIDKSPILGGKLPCDASQFELLDEPQALQGIDLACAQIEHASSAEQHWMSLEPFQRAGLRTFALDNQPLHGHLDLRARLKMKSSVKQSIE